LVTLTSALRTLVNNTGIYFKFQVGFYELKVTFSSSRYKYIIFNDVVKFSLKTIGKNLVQAVHKLIIENKRKERHEKGNTTKSKANNLEQ